MKILVTNDDGIFADGLWVLVRELKKIAEVAVVAPDRELSAIGTAVSLHRPVRAKEVTATLPGVDTYAIEGTPADSVILGLQKLVTGKVAMVISGINRGANLGDDILISGTVSGALQGYLRSLPAIAISVALVGKELHFDSAAKVAALLAKKLDSGILPPDICLNVNLPNAPLEKIRGIKITHPASRSHDDYVEERFDNGRQHYWFVRRNANKAVDEKTDTWALEHGYISITLLFTSLLNKPVPPLPDNLCNDLFKELKDYSL